MRSPITTALFAATIATTAHAQTNLVANGGFDFTISPWTRSVPHPGSTQYNYVPNFGHTAMGAWYFSEISPLDDSIYQAIDTVPNVTYTFSFWVYNFTAGSDHLFAKWDTLTVVDQRPVSPPAFQWTQVSVQITATQPISLITIGGYGTAQFLVIDDVSVTANIPPCVADVDDGSGTGTPDHGVTIDDLLYFLVIFEQGSLTSDVDDGSFTGTRDNGVTIDDLLYYLFRFESGC